MQDQKIYFFNEDCNYILKGKQKIRSWIDETITKEKKRPGSINYIFCSDDYLFEINETYLNHTHYTDIITFDNSESDEEISGDIFISIERIKENAIIFKSKLFLELLRVIIHGILHLIGYNDMSKAEKEIMRSKEDYYLSLFTESV